MNYSPVQSGTEPVQSSYSQFSEQTMTSIHETLPSFCQKRQFVKTRQSTDKYEVFSSSFRYTLSTLLCLLYVVVFLWNECMTEISQMNRTQAKAL